jgi:plastocyanin
MTKLLALILACVALGLASCGGDDDDDNGGGGGGAASTSEQPAGGGGGAGGGGVQVSLKNIQFNPKDVTVKPGETITFTNDESIPHDVHKESGPGGDFASGPDGGMQQGDTFKLKLDQPGTYKYVCHVHAPGMAGTITVK